MESHNRPTQATYWRLVAELDTLGESPASVRGLQLLTPRTSSSQLKLEQNEDPSPTHFISQAGNPAAAPRKRQMEKCNSCRQRKAKCIPVSRDWSKGEKCNKCQKHGLLCGPNTRAERRIVKATVSVSRQLSQQSTTESSSSRWSKYSMESADSGVALDSDFEERDDSPRYTMELYRVVEPSGGIFVFDDDLRTPPSSGPTNGDGLERREVTAETSTPPCPDRLENCPELQEDSPTTTLPPTLALFLVDDQDHRFSGSYHAAQPSATMKDGGYSLVRNSYSGNLHPTIENDPVRSFEPQSFRTRRFQSPLSINSPYLESSFESPMASEGELSFVDAGSDDLEDAEIQISDPRWCQLREQFITKFIQSYLEASQDSLVDAESSSQTSGSSSTPSKNNENAATSITTPSSAKSFAKRSRDNENNDEENFQDRRRNEKRQKLNADPVTAPRGRLFACPYCKFDPTRYSAENTSEKLYQKCPGHFLPNITRLKQHLYRNHSRPEHYCGSCYEEFEEQGQLELHGRKRPPCTIRNSPFEEKMTPDQFKKIKKRGQRGSGQDGTEEWFNIFKILFPGCEPPDSPFVECISPAAVQHVDAYFELRAPEILAQILRDTIPGPLHLTQSQQDIFEGALGDIVARLVQEMGQDFHLTALTGSISRLRSLSAAPAPSNALVMSRWNTGLGPRTLGLPMARPPPPPPTSSSRSASVTTVSGIARGVEPEERNQSLLPQPLQNVFGRHDARMNSGSTRQHDNDTYALLDTPGRMITSPTTHTNNEISPFNEFDAAFAGGNFPRVPYPEHSELTQYAYLEITAPTPPPNPVYSSGVQGGHAESLHQLPVSGFPVSNDSLPYNDFEYMGDHNYQPEPHNS